MKEINLKFKEWFYQFGMPTLYEMAMTPPPEGATAKELLRQGYKYFQSKFTGEMIYWNPRTKLTHRAADVPGSPEHQGQPAPQPAQERPKPKNNENDWFKATVINDDFLDVYGLKQNEVVAIQKSPKGEGRFLTRDGRLGTIPYDQIKSVVKFENANGQFIKGSPDEILAQQKRTDLIPTKYQQGIYDDFESGNMHIMINALAGTGKTTVLKQLAKKFKKPGEKWLYLVFNKKNQEEGSKEFKALIKAGDSAGITVKTSHSFLGDLIKKSEHTALKTDLPGKGNFNKIDQILHDGGKEGPNYWYNDRCDDLGLPYALRYYSKKVVKQLAGLAKSYAINMNDTNDAKKILQQILDDYDVDASLEESEHNNGRDYTNAIIELTLETLHQSMPGNAYDPKLRQIRDHDDTLWWAVTNSDKIPWPKYDVVLADEVQDFNKAQQIMLKQLDAKGARIVAVGDPNQSIYRFRGADAESFGNLQGQLASYQKGYSVHNLPTNFRSGSAIIDFVNNNTHVKHLESPETDIYGNPWHKGVVTVDGNVQQGESHKKQFPANEDEMVDELAKEWHNHQQLERETAIIARTNAPLAQIAMQLLKNNIQFVILGRDFSKELISHIEKITGKGYKSVADQMSMPEFLNEMAQWTLDLEEKYRGDIRHAGNVQEAKDNSDAIAVVANYLMQKQDGPKLKNVRDFIQQLKTMFDEKSINAGDDNQGESFKDKEDLKKYEELKKNPRKSVTLTTAHKSKGLQFSRVYAIRNDLYPHPKATRPKDLAQEENARYVAWTRAEHELHVLHSPKEE